MKKRTVILCALILGLVSIFTFMTAYSQEDVVSVKDSAFKDTQRDAAVFPHDEHNEKANIEDCGACHHIYEDRKKVADESSEDRECSECHKLKSGDNARPLMKAYHDLCKACHLEMKKGPIMCGECHSRLPLRGASGQALKVKN